MAMIGRRGVLIGAGALLALGGCTTGLGSASGLESRVETTRNYLLATYPDAAAMVQSAAGVLYMPLMTEAAFGPGAAYGEGALKVNDQTADYYSAVQGTFGVQAGAQQYSHVLIFRTPEALASFRAMPGWVAAAEAFYALPAGGQNFGADSLAMQMPVVAMIFGQSGLMAGAAIEGTKYTRVSMGQP